VSALVRTAHTTQCEEPQCGEVAVGACARCERSFCEAHRPADLRRCSACEAAYRAAIEPWRDDVLGTPGWIACTILGVAGFVLALAAMVWGFSIGMDRFSSLLAFGPAMGGLYMFKQLSASRSATAAIARMRRDFLAGRPFHELPAPAVRREVAELIERRRPQLAPPPEEALIAAWTAVAQRRGGNCRVSEAASSWKYDRWPAMEVPVDGVAVSAAVDAPHDGPFAGTLCTVLTAAMRFPPAPRLDINPEGLGGALARRFSIARERPIPALGPAFTVDAERPELCAAAMPWQVAVAFGQLPGETSLRVADREARLVVDHAIPDEETLERALSVIANVAAADPLGIGFLHELPGARPQLARDGELYPLVAIELGGVIVELGPMARGDVLGTAAWVSGADGRWQLELRAGQPLPTDAALARLAAAAAELGASHLWSDRGVITLWWEASQREPDAVLAGAKLIAEEVASPRTGVYR
jgi:hypothetical protein